MSEVKWIKIAPDVFDDDKFLLIESMPEADAIMVIWFKLLCMAGKHNNGAFMLNDKIAYTDEMLAIVLRKDLNIVQLALKTFEKYGMIEISNGIISIPNWRRDSICENKQMLRATTQYKEWRNAVFERDRYTCQQCGKYGVKLNAHHILPFAEYPESRLDVENGVTLCESCHRLTHKRGDLDAESDY